MSALALSSSTNPFGIHAGEDACAADGHIGVLLSDEHRGAYGVVSAACGVRAENTDQNRNTELCKLCIAVERGAAAAASGEQKAPAGRAQRRSS